MAYLSGLELKNMYPKKNNIIRHTGRNLAFDARNSNLGGRRATAISQALSLTETKQVNLAGNNLSPRDGRAIIKKLSPFVEDLTMDKNALGNNRGVLSTEFSSKLVSKILNGKFKLKALSLAGTSLKDCHFK